MTPKTITVDDVIAATKRLEALGEGLAGCTLVAREAIPGWEAFGMGVQCVVSPYVPDGKVCIIRPPKVEPIGGFKFVPDPMADAKPDPFERIHHRMQYAMPIFVPEAFTRISICDSTPTADERRASRKYWRDKKRARITANRKARKKRRLYLRHQVRLRG